MSHETEDAGITCGTKISIQKELECITEAMNEYQSGAESERKKVILDEVTSRAWAAIYLIQYADGQAQKPSNYEEVLREARAYDCWGGADAREESGLFDDEESLH